MTAKTFFLAALVAASSPAWADTQLERSLGVAPGTFSATELGELKRAYDDEDRTRIRHLMRKGGAAVLSTRGATAPIDGGLSVGDRFLIATALEENRFQTAAFVAAGGAREAPNGVARSKAHLASELGVSADAYSVAELVKMRDERDD